MYEETRTRFYQKVQNGKRRALEKPSSRDTDQSVTRLWNSIKHALIISVAVTCSTQDKSKGMNNNN